MTDLTFFTNETGRTLADRFRAILKGGTKYLDILVGFFRISGFYMLYDALEETDKIRVIVGINTDKPTYNLWLKAQRELSLSSNDVLKNTSEAFIKELEEVEESFSVEKGALKFIEFVKSGKLELRVYPKHPIHAKVYIIRKDPEKSEDFGKVITGSSNFTYSGLVDNLEFNVELKNRADVEYALEKFEELWKESIPLNEDFVEEIKAKTWLNDSLTPYELYLKFLYEYLKDKVDLDKKELSDGDYPPGFIPLEYQKEAVIDAKNKIEQFGGVLLADVVGLGKTYVSAMLARELGGSNLVIAPPHLVEYWQKVLVRFGVSATVISLGKLDSISEDEHSFYKNLFIDEAHRFRNEDTKTYEKLHLLAQGKRVILISATPYNNRPRDVASLIYLFQKKKNSTIPMVRDLETFFNTLENRLKNIDRVNEKEKYLKEVREVSKLMRERVLRHVMVRRTRREVMEYFKEDLERRGVKFPKVKDPQKIYYLFDEDLDKLFEETLEFIKDFGYVRYYPLAFLKEPLEPNDPLVTSLTNLRGIMRTRLLKRLESSPYAFKKSLENFINSYENFIKMVDRGTVYISKQVNVYDYIESDREEELLELIESGKKEVHVYKSEDFKPEFRSALEKDLEYLREIYSKWEKLDYDPKLVRLRELLGELRGKKVILFTEFIDTAQYLRDSLKELVGDRLFLYSSRSSDKDREKIERNFNPNHPNKEDTIDLLITTDALAEGINLHESNIVINYDIPWNPTKVLQRIGRVNRVGTRHDEIHIFNFFPASQIEENIGLEISALAKLQAFHHALGEDAKYLDPEVEEVDTHRLFETVNSARFIEEEEQEEQETELKYLKLLRGIRDNEPELYRKIKSLPKKAKTARSGDTNSLITLFRKGKLRKVFISTGGETEEIDFYEAVKLIECSPEEKRLDIDEEFYKLLSRNKEAFAKTLMEDKIRLRRNTRSQTYKFITYLKALINHPNLNEEDKNFLRTVLNRAEEGTFPEKSLLKKLNRQLSTTGDDIEEKIDTIRKGIPAMYLKDDSKNSTEEEAQVILSVYLKPY